jgi:hypothetical protein
MSDNRQQQQPQQTFLGMPMNWEWDLRKMARNYWNPDDERIFPPKVFGIGWDVNGYALFRLLGMLAGREAKKE